MLPKHTAATGGKTPSATPAGDARLLHDIETLSKALSLDQKNPRHIPKKPPTRSISAPKSHPQNPKNPNQKASKDLNKVKKPSFWSNFYPIKSLSAQFRSHRRFGCRFSLHVHSVDNLPPIFSDSTLAVQWKRTTDPQAAALSTRPVRVFESSAEFDEILTCSCSIYGARSGPKGSAKYEAKHFMVSVKVLDHQDLDLGKNLTDLTRLLPVRLEELDEDGGRLGEWSTSFRLSGKARGASLNVSFGFAVIGDEELAADEKKVGMVGSMARSRDRTRSVEDVRVLHEVLPCSKPEDWKFDSKKGFLEEGFNPDEELNDLKTVKGENEYEEHQFMVIEQGVEIAGKDKIGEPELEKTEFRAVERVEVAAREQVMETGSEKTELVAVERVEAAAKDQNSHVQEEDSEMKPDFQLEEALLPYGRCEDSVIDCLDSGFGSPSILVWEKEEHALLEEATTPNQMSYADAKSKYKAGAMKSKSLSLDDEAVASEFLSMIGMDHSPFTLSSDSDTESPKEQLWKQFMKESLSTKNNIFVTEFGAEKEPEWIDGDFAEDFDLSSIIQEAESELQTATQASQANGSKSRAKMMEDAETEALMRQWGLNEKAFHHLPPGNRSGFGSPIDMPPEEPLELPPLGEGLGPFVQTNDGGFLRSMSPSLFKNAKNNGSLIMQVSSPVVVPAEMGSGIMEILQRLASVGIEKLSMQAKKLMHLEDVTGKTMQQMVWEAAPALESCESQESPQHLKTKAGPSVNQTTSGRNKKSKNLNANVASVGEVGSEYVSLEDLAPLAMDKIEALSIEGLRIQSGMSNDEATPNISPQSIGDISALEGRGTMNNIYLGLEGTGGLQLLDVKDSGDDVDGLMGLSITLDEWMRLDSGVLDDEDVASDRTSKILAAHHACAAEMVKSGGKRTGRRWGLLGNTFTVALMVQLRDPLRNYEPVGAPMLSLIQVERVFIPPKLKIFSTVSDKGNSEEPDDEHENKTEQVTEKEKKEEDDVVPQFKITEVHVAGIKAEPCKKKLWGNPVQQQSGSRWLLATGMGKSNKHPFMKSKAVSKPSPVTTTVQPGDTLWSISSRTHGNGAKWKELLTLNPHIRNPNVIFPNETIRLR